MKLNALLLLVFLTSGALAEKPKPPMAEIGKAKSQQGKASWYGKDFKKTASGERYDPNSMTAAHRTLPFGTQVKVTNVKNGCSAVVRINNRGPYTRGRIIDVSKAAAQQLNMINSGVALVKIEVLSSSKTASPQKTKGR